MARCRKCLRHEESCTCGKVKYIEREKTEKEIFLEKVLEMNRFFDEVKRQRQKNINK